MSRSVQPPRVINVEDLRQAAKRRLPRVVFDYIDGGAEAEQTLRANGRAFEEVTRVARWQRRCAICAQR
jgi:isopentenyl diphosphate isomerase/L-lactate dehydrogenase-like FMN-dependent dehydrogenase